MAADGLVARPVEGLVEVRDACLPIRVLIASLAPGGAERIVLEWLGAESARGREAHLAVLNARRDALAAPIGVGLRVRGRESPEEFLRALATEWRSTLAPISTHLVADAHLALLWEHGVRTVPVVHNSRPGWRNAPASWDPRHVPQAVGCAAMVRAQMLEAGCQVPVIAIRHRPRVGPAATDMARREEIRAELGVGAGTFLVGAIGALKAQKDHARAVEVVAELARRRDAALVVLGGLLEPAALPELERVLDCAIRLGMTDRLRLPGFVRDIEPWLAACDAIVNVSRFEGLSMAVQEALAAGLPVVAADVGGQREIVHPALELLPAEAGPARFAERFARMPVRTRLEPRPLARAPRAWSLTLAHRGPGPEALDTLFVTANLNAGGAQRSLANLAVALAGRHRFAVAVCGVSTQADFAASLAAAGVETFRPAHDADDFGLAESLLAHAAARGVRTLCFWNAPPGLKLLLARFAPQELRLVDASPGRYAFEELESSRELGEAIDFPPEAYYARLDTLVLKHADTQAPSARRVVRIPNGVSPRRRLSPRAGVPRFLVSGRIAPSKRLETILAALAIVARDLPAVALEVIGTAEPRHAAYAASLLARAAPGVRFRGTGTDLAHLDEPWTATIVLGTHQGCPNAVLEAMAAGIPVIANASGGTGELIAHGESGWLLAEDVDAGALAAAMREAWEEGGEAERRAANALLAAGRFGLDAMATEYLGVLAGGKGREKMAA